MATQTYEKLMTMSNFMEGEKVRKEENIRELDLALEISLPIPSVYMLWQPWIKGYAGEVGIGHDQPEFGGIMRHIWIDRVQKTKITGIKE